MNMHRNMHLCVNLFLCTTASPGSNFQHVGLLAALKEGASELFNLMSP